MVARPDSDVERALKAFGDLSLKYRSFGAMPLKFGQALLMGSDPAVANLDDMPLGPAADEPTSAAEAYSLLGSALAESHDVRVQPRSQPRPDAWSSSPAAPSARLESAKPAGAKLSLAERALGAHIRNHPQPAPPPPMQPTIVTPNPILASVAAPEPPPPPPILRRDAPVADFHRSDARPADTRIVELHPPDLSRAPDLYRPEPPKPEPRTMAAALREPLPSYRPTPEPIAAAVAPVVPSAPAPTAAPEPAPLLVRRGAAPSRQPLAGLFRTLAEPATPGAPRQPGGGPERPSA